MNPNDVSEALSFITSAATIVQIQKWLKGREYYKDFVKTFPGADRYAHWIAAGLMSLIAAAGIHAVWKGDVTNGGLLTIQIPSMSIILHGVSDWFKVYILQHTIYDAQINKTNGGLNGNLAPSPVNTRIVP